MLFPDKRLMGNRESFAEILREKIQDSTQSQSENTYFSKAPPPPPEAWAGLIGQLDPLESRSAKVSFNAYLKQCPPRPDHVLNETQNRAFAFLKKHDGSLKGSFSRGDLKRAFRLIAKKLHPDQGGTAAEMRELLQARNDLQTVFSS